jgi:hypothetical protein
VFTTFRATRLSVCQRSDNLAEDVEGLVDINAFFGLYASGPCQTLLLATCQIHELQLRHCHVIGVPQVLTFNSEAENAMRA